MLWTWKWSTVFQAIIWLQVSDSNTGLWNVWTNASEWWLHTFLLLLPLVFTGLQTWWVISFCLWCSNSALCERCEIIFQDMHIMMLPILVGALMREEKIQNRTLGIFINKSVIKETKSCLLYLLTVIWHFLTSDSLICDKLWYERSSHIDKMLLLLQYIIKILILLYLYQVRH
jgi:hypothetical protein